MIRIRRLTLRLSGPLAHRGEAVARDLAEELAQVRPTREVQERRVHVRVTGTEPGASDRELGRRLAHAVRDRLQGRSAC